MDINDIAYFQFIEDFQELNGIYQVSKIVDYTSIIEDNINLFELYENLGIQDRYKEDEEKFLIENETFYTLTNADDILNNNAAKRAYTIPKFAMGDFVPDTTNIAKFGDFVILMDLGSFKTDDIRIKPIVEELKQIASRYFDYVVNTSIAVSNNRYNINDSSDEYNSGQIKTPQKQYDELTKLNNENIDLKEKLKALEDLVLALPRLEAKKDEIIGEISDEQRRVDIDTDSAEAALRVLRADISRLEIEKNQKDNSLRNVETSIANNEIRQAALLARIAELENQEFELGENRDETISGLRIQLREEQTISTTLRSEKQALENSIRSLNNEINTKDIQINDLESRIAVLEADKVRLSDTINDRINEINNLNANIVTAEENRAALQVTINENANRINELTEELRLVRSRLLADAGSNQSVNSETLVTLDGSGSTTPEGITALYSWESYENSHLPIVEITGSDSAVATFVTPALRPGENDIVYKFLLTLKLSASNIVPGQDDDNSDIVLITVKSPNASPIANAGNDQHVNSEIEVTLNGSGSNDPDGNNNNLRYSWERTGGTEGRSVRLINPNTVSPTFTSDSIIPGAPPITHIFTLTVTDEEDGVSTDTVSIIVTGPPAPNRAPIAHAGLHRTVFSGETVTLDGSGSYDPDGNNSTLTYFWEHTSDLPSGITEPILADNRAKITVFTADIISEGDPISHEFTLTVTDTKGASGTITVVITVKPNAGPIVNAGDDQTVETGDTVVINGSGRDPDGGNVNYEWIKVGGTGRGDILTNPSVTTNASSLTFTADTLANGANNVTHLFQLIVTEASVTSLTSSDTVRITVLAPNTLPVARAGSNRSVRDNNLITLDGSQSYDPDGGQLTYSWERLSGTGNSNLVLNNADTSTPTFRSDDLSSSTSTVTHVFRLTVTDSRNGTHSDEITITVRLPSRYPHVDAGDDQIIDLNEFDETANNVQTVTLDASRSSTNSGSLRYNWVNGETINGNSVTLINPETSGPTFTYNISDVTDGQSDITHIFRVTVTNSENLSSTGSVNVIIKSKNAAPIAKISDNIITVQSGNSVRVESESIDIDNHYPLAHIWTRVGGTNNGNADILNNITVDESILSFIGDTLVDGSDAVVHEIQLRVTDNKQKTDDDLSTDIVEVVIESNDDGPVANAGDDQTVASGAIVNLNGNSSTGTISTYAWSKIGGITGRDDILTSPSIVTNTSTLTFTADTLSPGDDPVNYIFQLKITDNQNKTSSDTIIITVQSGNQKPISIAGQDRHVRYGTQVQLDGSRSYDPDGDNNNLTYNWERTGGTGDANAIDLVDEDTPNPSFSVDNIIQPGSILTHIFTLTVTDEDDEENENTDTNTVTVFVNGPNQKPIANAGIDKIVTTGNTVTLDGSNSSDPDPNDSIVTYEWTRIAGSKALIPIFDLSTPSQPSFTANRIEKGDEEIVHVFQLIVSDREGLKSDPDTVRVTINPPSSKPNVTIDPPLERTVISGDTVTISGEAKNTDRSANIFTYLWSRVSGTGITNLVLNNSNTDTVSFTADTLVAGANPVIQTLKLTATNTKMMSNDSPEIIITILPPVNTPIADAGPDQSVTSNREIQINSFNSRDPVGGGLTYLWSRVSGTGNANIVLNNKNTRILTVTGDILERNDAPVTHVFRLTVTDTDSNSHSDDMILTVLARNLPPISNAGGDQRVTSGSEVELNGSDSFDQNTNGSITSYLWTRIGGTGIDIQPTFRDQSISCFVADILKPNDDPVTHDFRLEVTDDRGSKDSDTVTVTVVPLSQANLAPVANAGGNISVIVGELITLDGTGSYDPDGDVNDLTYRWTIERKTGTGSLISISNATNVQPSLNIPSDATASTYDVTLFVNDGINPPVSDTVLLTLNESTNIAPIADIFIRVFDGLEVRSDVFQRTPKGLFITLNIGNSSDPDGNIVTTEWNVETISGSVDYVVRRLTIRSTYLNIYSNTPQTGDVVLRVTLTVTDNGIPSLSHSVSKDITIQPYVEPIMPNVVIIYDVSNIDYVSGSTIRLTTFNGYALSDLVSYTWTRTGGTGNANILSGVTVNLLELTFVADTLTAGSPSVTHDFTITVTDVHGGVVSDSITITVVAPIDNTAPNIVLPNNFTVDSGDPITISSTVTDDGTISTYIWSRLSGSGNANILNGITTNESTLTIPVSDTIASARPAETKTHTFELAVTDSSNNVARSRITITVRGPLQVIRAPKISFTPRTISATYNFAGITNINLNNQLVNLDNRDLTYSWTLTHISGSDAMRLNSTNTRNSSLISTTTTPTEDMVYDVKVTVTDSESLNDNDTVRVNIFVPQPPSGRISPSNNNWIIRPNDRITMSAIFPSTLPENSNLIYNWSFVRTSGSANYISISNTDRQTAYLSVRSTAQNSNYVVTLRVTNRYSRSTTIQINISVIRRNRRPVAIISGGDKYIPYGSTIVLDGSSSYDPDGSPLTYRWIIGGEIYGHVYNGNTATPTFIAPTLGQARAGGGVATGLNAYLYVSDIQGYESRQARIVIRLYNSGHGASGAVDNTPSISFVGITNNTISFMVPENLRRITTSISGFDNEDVTYRWSRIGGTGLYDTNNVRSSSLLGDLIQSDIVFSSEKGFPRGFDFTNEITHILQVRVQNRFGKSATNQVKIVIKPNTVTDYDPTAIITLVTGSTYTAENSYDPNGNIDSYLWELIFIDGIDFPEATLVNVSEPTVTPSTNITAETVIINHNLAPGASARYKLSLTVRDITGRTNKISKFVILSGIRRGGATGASPPSDGIPDANILPSANAGEDTFVRSNQRVQLDGSDSSDFYGTIVSYLWERINGSSKNEITLSDPNIVNPTFIADTLEQYDHPVTHKFRLTVTDNQGGIDTDSVTITVSP